MYASIFKKSAFDYKEVVSLPTHLEKITSISFKIAKKDFTECPNKNYRLKI